MIRYLLVRFSGFLFVLVGVTFLVHLLIAIVPGDPIDSIAGQSISDEDRAKLRLELGLDEPFLVQYGKFVGRVLRLDFGRSFITRRPIADDLFERLPRTFLLASSALAVAVTLGLLLGIVTAAFPRGRTDRAVMLLAVIGVSAPVFVTAIVFRYFLAEKFPLFPPAGYGGLAFLVLPALTLGTRSAAFLARITRTTLLDILSEDFMRTARAKGLSKFRALKDHALINAAGPLISVVILDFAMYLNGSIITEIIFAWPGVGRYMFTAISQRDLPVIQAIVLLMAVTYVAAILISDIVRAWIDPRLR